MTQVYEQIIFSMPLSFSNDHSDFHYQLHIVNFKVKGFVSFLRQNSINANEVLQVRRTNSDILVFAQVTCFFENSHQLLFM